MCSYDCWPKKLLLALVEPSHCIVRYFVVTSYFFPLPCVTVIFGFALYFVIVIFVCMSLKPFAALRRRKKAAGVMKCKKVLKAAKCDRNMTKRGTPMKGTVDDEQAVPMMKRPAMKRLPTAVGVMKCKNRKPRWRSMQQVCAHCFGKILRLCTDSYEKINHIRVKTRSRMRLSFKVFCF